MANLKERLEGYVISDAARNALSPEELAELDAVVNRLRTHDYDEAHLVNVDKFDAKDMVPVGQEEPVNWNPKKPDPTRAE